MKPLTHRDRHELLREYFLNAYLIAMTLELGKELAESEPPKKRKKAKAEMEISIEALLQEGLE